MSEEFEAKAALVVHNISGPDWRRFCELGDSARVVDAIASALRDAVKAEREACANVADDYRDDGDWSHDTCEAIAASIRYRGDSENAIETTDIP